MAARKKMLPKDKPCVEKIDVATLNQAIAAKAYELYEKRGHLHGRDMDDWLEAERIILNS